MSRIFQTQVESVSGATVNTKAGSLIQIGNLQINKGDFVQTDGRYVYGHQPYLSGGVFVAKEPDGGIPLVLWTGEGSKKAYYSIAKNKVIEGKGQVITDRLKDNFQFYFANTKNKWGYHGYTDKDVRENREYSWPENSACDFDILNGEPVFYDGLQTQRGDEKLDFSEQFREDFRRLFTVPYDPQMGYKIEFWFGYLMDCSVYFDKNGNGGFVRGTSTDTSFYKDRKPDGHYPYYHYVEYFAGEIKTNIFDYEFNYKEYSRRIDAMEDAPWRTEEYPQQITSHREIQDGYYWEAPIDFSKESYADYFMWGNGIILDGRQGARFGTLYNEKKEVIAENIQWSDDLPDVGEFPIRRRNVYAPKGICKIGQNKYLCVMRQGIATLENGVFEYVEINGDIKNSRLRIMDEKTLKKWLDKDDIITGNDIFE